MEVGTEEWSGEGKGGEGRGRGRGGEGRGGEGRGGEGRGGEGNGGLFSLWSERVAIKSIYSSGTYMHNTH